MIDIRSRPAAALAKASSLEAVVEFIELDRQRVASLANQVNQPHRHEYQEIIWVRTGSADHVLDGENVRVPASSLLVIPMGRIHRFAPAPGLTGCVVRFRQAFLPHASSILFNHFVGYSSVPVPSEAAAELDALFGLIRGEVQNGDWSSRSPLRHLLRALVAKIEAWWRRVARLQPQILTDSQRLWERFARLVEERFRFEHAAGFYARELGVPLRRLNAVARLFAGATTEEALARRLMLEARRQLLFSDLGVGEVSFALGFEEHSYFTRVFRKQVGMTPSKFRETNRGSGRGELTGPESASFSSESVTARRRSELP